VKKTRKKKREDFMMSRLDQAEKGKGRNRPLPQG